MNLKYNIIIQKEKIKRISTLSLMFLISIYIILVFIFILAFKVPGLNIFKGTIILLVICYIINRLYKEFRITYDVIGAVYFDKETIKFIYNDRTETINYHDINYMTIYYSNYQMQTKIIAVLGYGGYYGEKGIDNYIEILTSESKFHLDILVESKVHRDLLFKKARELEEIIKIDLQK